MGLSPEPSEPQTQELVASASALVLSWWRNKTSKHSTSSNVVGHLETTLDPSPMMPHDAPVQTQPDFPMSLCHLDISGPSPNDTTCYNHHPSSNFSLSTGGPCDLVAILLASMVEEIIAVLACLAR